MQKKINYYTKLVKVNIILRIIFGPLIFLSPLIVTIINLILDGFDGELFKRGGYARPQYSIYDKILDYWWYVWIIAYVMATDAPAKYLFLILFTYRTIGQILFLIFHEGYILFIFPNIFELVFFYYLGVKLIHIDETYMSGTPLIIATIILSIIAFVRETIVHLKKMNFSSVYLGKTSYWPIKTINPYKAFIFLSLLIALPLFINQYLSIQTKQTYESRAAKALRNGVILSYDPKGILSGMFYYKTNTQIVRLIKVTKPKEQTICDNKELSLLETKMPEGTTFKTKYVFIFNNSCLTSLTDGTYGLFMSEENHPGPENLIEFSLVNGKLGK
jgi:hypothetical protein